MAVDMQHTYEQVLHKLGQEEVATSVAAVAESTGLPPSRVLSAKRQLEQMGILETYSTYDNGSGRVSHWRLKVPLEQALLMLRQEPTAATAGPEPDPPMRELLKSWRADDAEAYVAVVRQYRDRWMSLQEHLTHLEQAGISLKLSPAEAFGLEVVPEYEGVMKLLPLLDRLETRIQNISRDRDHWQAKATTHAGGEPVRP